MIIQRYTFKELFPPFGISLIFFSFVFIMAKLPEITDYVVNFQIGISTVALLLMYSLPYFLQFTIPMSVMIAVLITFLRMSGDMEIIALKAGGVHIYRLLPPVLVFGLIGVLLTVFMSVFALPAGRKQSRQMLMDVAAAHVDVGLKPRQFISIYKDVTIYIHEIDHATKALVDVFIEDRRSGKLSITVIAPRGQLSYDPERSIANLRLYGGTMHQVDLVERRANAIHFETYDLRLEMSRSFESLNNLAEDVEEMSLARLRQTIEAAQPGSDLYYDALQEWHKKFSMPAACLVMALLAMPLGIRSRSSQRAYGIGLGLFFFLLYYMMLSVGWVLAESGIYPPGVGMWMPNVVLLAIGVVVLVRTAEEKPLMPPTVFNRLNLVGLRKFRMKENEY